MEIDYTTKTTRSVKLHTLKPGDAFTFVPDVPQPTVYICLEQPLEAAREMSLSLEERFVVCIAKDCVPKLEIVSCNCMVYPIRSTTLSVEI